MIFLERTMLDLCCKSIDFQEKAIPETGLLYIWKGDEGLRVKMVPESIIIIFLDNYVDIFAPNSYISNNQEYSRGQA
jgi:hypothetical protein